MQGAEDRSDENPKFEIGSAGSLQVQIMELFFNARLGGVLRLSVILDASTTSNYSGIHNELYRFLPVRQAQGLLCNRMTCAGMTVAGAL